MKKLKLRKLVAFFLSLVMLAVGLPLTHLPLGNMNVVEAEAAMVTKTQSEAMAWVSAQVGKSLDYDGAYGAQCVDLIAYYLQYLGVSRISGNACDYTTASYDTSKLTRIQGAVPQAGDILIYTGGYGHVAIFETTYYSYHQNWNGQYVERLNRAYNQSFWTSAEGVTKYYWGVIRPNFSENSTPSVPSIAEGDYYIQNKTGMFLTSSYNGNTSGTNVDVWSFNANTGFRVRIYSAPTGYKMQFRNCESTGVIINPYADVPKNGTNVNLYPDMSDSTQWWYFENVSGNYYAIRSVYDSSLCMALNPDSTGYGNVTLQTYTGADGQLWILHPYVSGTVTFNANGGSNAPSSQSKYYNETLTLSSLKPTRIGYTFTGWNTKSDGTGTSYAAGGAYTFNAGLLVYAQWTPMKYTVTLNANAGTCSQSSISVTYDSKYGTLPVPTRNGYTFTGWYTAANGGTKITADTKVSITASQTLYAQWEKIVYNPSGNLEKVSGGTQSVSVKGWAFDRDDLSKALAIHIYVGGPAGSSTGTYAGSITANVWRSDVEKVYPGVGNYHGYEATVNIAKTGSQSVYVYAINVGGGANVLLGTKTVTIEPYTISYNANGGSGAPGSQTKVYGTDLILSSTIPTRTGYTFTGWNTKADGSGTSYVKEAKYTINANVTLYAQWLPNTYTIVYNGNGATSGSIASSSHIYDTAKTLTANGYSKTGYTFKGWNTEADGSGTAYTNSQSVKNLIATNKGSITLYAQWTQMVEGLPFVDVKHDAWYANAVKYMYDNGIMSGTTATTFSPSDNLTRGQVVVMLWNLVGNPDVKVTGRPYSDVAVNKYYSKAVQWAKDNGIVNGYTNGNFGPGDPITRQDFVIILKNFAKFRHLDTANTSSTSYKKCSDYKQVSAYAVSSIEWAYERGLIGSNGKLNPRGEISRAEAASILQRFMLYYFM